MDIFKTPGGSLLGNDKDQYDELKVLVDKATSDFLIKSDWDSNIACVDKINTLVGPNVLPEIVFLLRRKLTVRDPKPVVMCMHLIESLVNNCGARFHHAMNDDKFMKEMGNVARKFSGKMGEDNRQAAEVSLDLIQAWGEAFLPKQNQYPHIVRLYMDLRKEGLHFKEKQFDSTRIPIATHDTHTSAMDSALAASLQAEINSAPSQHSSSSKPRRNTRDFDEEKDDNVLDDFAASFYNSEVFHGDDPTTAKNTRANMAAAAAYGGGGGHSNNNRSPRTVKKPDSFDPSQYPDHDFNDTGRPAARPTPAPAPVSKQKSTRPGDKRDSFDPSLYPDYDFNDTGRPVVQSPVSSNNTNKQQHHGRHDSPSDASRATAGGRGKAVKPGNKRDSFDPSMYPDYNFNEDPFAHNLAIASVSPTAVPAAEVIHSVTFSLSILRDLILACKHERELRGNEVAIEVAQQVTTMQSKMTEVIERALSEEPDKVEELFALNEDAQSLLTIYAALTANSISLAVGKLKISQLVKLKPCEDSPAPLKASNTAKAPSPQLDLIGYDEVVGSSNHAHAHQQNHQQQQVHHHHNHHQQQHQQQQPHQQQQRQAPPQQQQAPNPPAQPVKQASRPFKLAPPPSVDSIYGNALKATNSDIIEVTDSTPDLDVLFQDPHKVHKEQQMQQHQQQQQHHQQQQRGQAGNGAFDPFSEAALDALFDDKAKIGPGAAAAGNNNGHHGPSSQLSPTVQASVDRAKQQIADMQGRLAQGGGAGAAHPAPVATATHQKQQQHQHQQQSQQKPYDPFSNDNLDALLAYNPTATGGGGDHTTFASTTPGNRSVPATPDAAQQRQQQHNAHYPQQSTDYYGRGGAAQPPQAGYYPGQQHPQPPHQYAPYPPAGPNSANPGYGPPPQYGAQPPYGYPPQPYPYAPGQPQPQQQAYPAPYGGAHPAAGQYPPPQQYAQHPGQQPHYGQAAAAGPYYQQPQQQQQQPLAHAHAHVHAHAPTQQLQSAAPAAAAAAPSSVNPFDDHFQNI